MNATSLAFAVLLGSGSFAACTDSGPGPDHDGDGDCDGDDPLDADPPAPVPLITDGVYDLASTLTVEGATLLPAAAHDALVTLEGLRDHPARTLFDLAEDAGVPAVGAVRDALPSSLESRIEGWIDEAIRDLPTGDGALPLVIDGVLSLAHAPVGELHLGSRLTLAGDVAQHRLVTVELEVAGRALRYDVAPLTDVGVELDATIAADIARDADRARLTLGGHGFGLPYGRLAWRAAEDVLIARHGGDLRALLGARVDCPAVAAAVAARCVLGVCVGHAADLRAICEGGLDRAVEAVRARVEAATIEPIALAAGAAVLVDGVDADHRASAIDAGVWTARLDLGQGARPAPATFTGARR